MFESRLKKILWQTGTAGINKKAASAVMKRKGGTVTNKSNLSLNFLPSPFFHIAHKIFNWPLLVGKWSSREILFESVSFFACHSSMKKKLALAKTDQIAEIQVFRNFQFFIHWIFQAAISDLFGGILKAFLFSFWLLSLLVQSHNAYRWLF